MCSHHQLAPDVHSNMNWADVLPAIAEVPRVAVIVDELAECCKHVEAPSATSRGVSGH